jgi:hypothetical protein
LSATLLVSGYLGLKAGIFPSHYLVLSGLFLAVKLACCLAVMLLYRIGVMLHCSIAVSLRLTPAAPIRPGCSKPL